MPPFWPHARARLLPAAYLGFFNLVPLSACYVVVVVLAAVAVVLLQAAAAASPPSLPPHVDRSVSHNDGAN